MGRAKLNMELITKEKSRHITYKKRKEGLMRKMHEFTTLCDVSACMIIYGPKQEKGTSSEPEIWPKNLEEVQRIIGIYKSKNKDSSNKTFGLSDFFHDRKRKIEDELAKLRKKNMEAKYPTWFEFLNNLPETDLRNFASNLNVKAETAKTRIEELKRMKEGLDMSYNLLDFTRMNLSHTNQYLNDFSRMNLQYPIDHHNNLMMRKLNENEHCMQQQQFGGNMQSGASVFYGSMVDPTMNMNPWPVSVLAPPAPYMHNNNNNNNNNNNMMMMLQDHKEDVFPYQM
ncbi:hypothetical protein ACJIZ3_001071 [Penstemon smallii]|uniref:MADS-box domain-containing protein n=1 Tax=Penstemon smallii TaxID=265156 RepID=A0ABD3U4Z0_9LAMI